MFENSVLMVATGFGLGWLPWAPGTFGSILGVPLAWWLMRFSPGRQIVAVVILLVMAVPICHFASLCLGGGDIPGIVADEYLAFPITVIGLAVKPRLWMLGAAFLLFRLFDATKLPPITYIEGIGGGLGIVLDDVMAAIYGWIVLAVGIASGRRYHRR